MERKNKKTVSPEPGDVLLVVDVQNDFLPGGALGVKNGDQIIAPVNQAVALFMKKSLPVFYSRDWHPRDHSSFQAHGGPWPPHCVQDTTGAMFSPDLTRPAEPLVFSKGTRVDEEEYSAFHAKDAAGKQVHQVLARLGVTRVFVCGLATDYCVLNTAMDLLKAGYKVYVMTDACCAVNVSPDDGAKALAKMIAEGAEIMKAEGFET